MLSDSSKSQTTVSLWSLRWRRISRELVERGADTLNIKRGIARDLVAAIEIGGRGGWQQVQGRPVHALDLEVGKAISLVDSPLARTAKPRRAARCAAAEGCGHHQATTISAVALGPFTRHFDHLRSPGTSMFLAHGVLAGNVGRVCPDVHLLALTLAVTCQGRVKADGLLILVLR